MIKQFNPKEVLVNGRKHEQTKCSTCVYASVPPTDETCNTCDDNYCNHSSRKISKYLKVKESYENDLMSMRNICKMPLFNSGDGDIDYTLDTLADFIFKTEKNLEWMKNNLLNIQSVVKQMKRQKK